MIKKPLSYLASSLARIFPSIGTRSILFGVHQGVFHPFTVWRAWRWLYGTNPDWKECIAIFCHDFGYWGLPNLDGAEGKTHPVHGSKLACRITFKLGYWYRRLRGYPADAASYYSFEDALPTFFLARYHSRELAKMESAIPSKLCWADKACVFFDPVWFYLLRARLAGELPEFKKNAEPFIGKVSDEEWLRWYRLHVLAVLARELPTELNRAIHGRRPRAAIAAHSGSFNHKYSSNGLPAVHSPQRPD